MLDQDMQEFIEKFDHTAIALRRVRDGLPLYKDLLGGEFHSAGESHSLGFRWVQLVYPGGGKIELLEPLSDDGFLARFLSKYGEGPHHMTFRVRRIETMVEIARARGYRVVDENYSDPHWKEAFISPRSAHGTIVQLAESDLTDAEERRYWPFDALADAVLRD